MTSNSSSNDLASIDHGGKAAHCALTRAGKGGPIGGDCSRRSRSQKVGQASRLPGSGVRCKKCRVRLAKIHAARLRLEPIKAGLIEAELLEMRKEMVGTRRLELLTSTVSR
jgi:hypothetical protein